MKKNAIGHMVAAREKNTHKISRWRILPKLLCLLLALVIWLAITQLQSNDNDRDGVSVGQESSLADA
ncbi:MAG: hypothetical protein IJF33_01485 [Clostridia bacterium]|nr:hypothetical protein [Clostridia bacterium]